MSLIKHVKSPDKPKAKDKPKAEPRLAETIKQGRKAKVAETAQADKPKAKAAETTKADKAKRAPMPFRKGQLVRVIDRYAGTDFGAIGTVVRTTRKVTIVTLRNTGRDIQFNVNQLDKHAE